MTKILQELCGLEITSAQAKLAATVEKYAASAPELARWLETNLPEGFTVFAFPEAMRKRLRTSNLCEALNKQIRRRTRVASIFPNPESCLRLVSAILIQSAKIALRWRNIPAVSAALPDELRMADP